MTARTSTPANATPSVCGETYHHGNLKAALLDEAVRRLELQRHASFSLSELARAVGVTPPAAYRHFADKDSLCLALAAHGFEQLGQAFEQAMPLLASPSSARAARRRFTALGDAYVRFSVAHPGLFQLMFGVEGEPFRARARQLPAPRRASAFGFLQAALRDLHRFGLIGRRPGPDDAWFAWCAIHGAAQLAIAGASTRVPIDRIGLEVTRRLVAAMSGARGP
jgi:AcrR family transcriptional regulator